MRRAALLHGMLAAAVATGCGGDDPPPSADEVEAALEDAVAAGAPGIALQIDGPEGEEFLSAGEASLDPARPIDPEDTYRIASVTKSFTAAIVMELVAEGELVARRHDRRARPGARSRRPVTSRSPSCSATRAASPTTSRTRSSPEVLSEGEELTPEQVLGFVSDLPPEFEPGSKYDYSDTDNLVLGFLIEEVTGNTYEEELESRIIEPLGAHRDHARHRFRVPGAARPGAPVRP